MLCVDMDDNLRDGLGKFLVESAVKTCYGEDLVFEGVFVCTWFVGF